MTDDFTRTVRRMVAENDVPRQREPDHRPIEPAGTVIEIEGGMEFVSNGFVWLACTPGDDSTSYRAFTPDRMNRRMWWVVSAASERI